MPYNHTILLEMLDFQSRENFKSTSFQNFCIYKYFQQLYRLLLDSNDIE